MVNLKFQTNLITSNPAVDFKINWDTVSFWNVFQKLELKLSKAYWPIPKYKGDCYQTFKTVVPYYFVIIIT